MELEQLREQLRQLDRGQVEILARLDDLAVTVRNVVSEIGGVPDSQFREPDRRSIRWRLHSLENDKQAIKIAEDAVRAATQARVAALERHESDSMNRFTRREKIIGLLLAALVAVGPYISAAFFR